MDRLNYFKLAEKKLFSLYIKMLEINEKTDPRSYKYITREEVRKHEIQTQSTPE